MKTDEQFITLKQRIRIISDLVMFSGKLFLSDALSRKINTFWKWLVAVT